MRKASTRLFLDEAQTVDESKQVAEGKSAPSFVLIGPEGGWTEEERELARKNSFQFVHFQTPILKVETASLCGAFFALQKMEPKPC